MAGSAQATPEAEHQVDDAELEALEKWKADLLKAAAMTPEGRAMKKQRLEADIAQLRPGVVQQVC